MKPGGVIFGATLLGQGIEMPNDAARKMMAFYNRKGIFSNREDDLEGLRSELEARFDEVKIEVLGCVALFQGLKAG